MSTTEDMSDRPNGHDTGHDGFWLGEAQCPYCNQPISRKQFKEIEARATAQIEAKAKAEIERAKRDAARAAEQTVKVLKATLETTITERVAAQREASEKKLTEAIAAERTRAYGERMKMDAQLADLQRQLQRRTANELGDEGELNLHDALMGAFPQDQVARTPKGVAGGDITQRVFSGGACIGSIIWEAKNHARWMSKWPGKARQDQLAAEADHCVLVTTAFPSGNQQLAIIEGVVVCSPARAVAVADILRRMVIQAHRLKLTNEARDAKVERLYSFLNSDRAADFWSQIEAATDNLVDLDRTETTAHQKTWTRRGELIRTVQAAREDLVGSIDAIIRGEPEDLL